MACRREAEVGPLAHEAAGRVGIEQQQAAQRAYEASARDHNEAAAGFTRAKEIAEAVRDTSAEFLRKVR